MVLPSSRNVGQGSRGIGDRNILNRRVASRSGKYDNVRSRLNTGLTVDRAIERASKSSAGRELRGEKFRRLKPSTFAQMLAEEAVEYLVLDVREGDDFDVCHARNSVSYPAPIFSHSMHPFSAEVLRYKNRDGAVIVLVDDDERLAAPAANLCYEKGVDNIFILSGGLRRLAEDAPSALIGELPPRPATAMSSKSPHRKYYGGSGASDTASLRSLPSYNSMRSVGSFMSHGGPGHGRAFRP